MTCDIYKATMEDPKNKNKTCGNMCQNKDTFGKCSFIYLISTKEVTEIENKPAEVFSPKIIEEI